MYYPKIRNTIFVTVTLFIVTVLTSAILYGINHVLQSESLTSYLLLIVNSFSFVLVTSYALNRSKIRIDELAVFNKTSIQFFGTALFLTFSIHIVGVLLSGLVFRNNEFSQNFVKSVEKSLPATADTTYFLTLFVAPFTEEFFFRGFILAGLLRNYSAKVAILTSAILFALIHINPSQMIGALLIGLFIGYVFYKTKNIFYAMAMHSFYNGLLYILPYLIYEFKLHEDKIHFEIGWYYIDLIDISGMLILFIFIPIFLKLSKRLTVNEAKSDLFS
ncbi:type II CAAX endopeptidase family protein [Leptospira sp. 96542]|nr:type II CAAX endopeptidase family protein [Leptospira sp. 96542]